jgi:hypothetical protein
MKMQVMKMLKKNGSPQLKLHAYTIATSPPQVQRLDIVLRNYSMRLYIVVLRQMPMVALKVFKTK